MSDSEDQVEEYRPLITDLDRDVVRKAVQVRADAGMPRISIRYEVLVDMGLEDALVQPEIDAKRYENVRDVEKKQLMGIASTMKAAEILEQM